MTTPDPSMPALAEGERATCERHGFFNAKAPCTCPPPDPSVLMDAVASARKWPAPAAQPDEALVEKCARLLNKQRTSHNHYAARTHKLPLWDELIPEGRDQYRAWARQILDLIGDSR